MKNILIIIIFTGIIYNFYSCEKFKLGDEFLSNPPDMTSINKDTVFSDIKYAERFLWGACATLPWGIHPNILNVDFLEGLTDIVSSAGLNPPYYDGLQKKPGRRQKY